MESASTTFTTKQMLAALSGVLLAVILSALDQNIVTTALPAIARELHGLEDLSWTVVAYLLAATIMTPLYGKLSDIYGRGRLMVIALSIFIVASVLCAASQTLIELILARALQGLGGGGLMVLSQAMIGDFVSPRERGRIQGITSTLWGMASIGGPVLGGFFVDYLSWRYVFWINIPIGLLSFVLCRRAMVRLPVTHVRRPVDFPGAALLIPGVTALLFVASIAGRTAGWWMSPPPLCALAIGITLIAAFIIWERRAAEPLLPARLFKKRELSLSAVGIFLVSVQLFTGIVMLPVFFQLVMQIGAGSSGALLIPLLASSSFAALAAGQFMRKTGRYKLLMPLAFTSSLVAFALLATMEPTTPLLWITIYMILLGIGVGTNYPVIMVSAQNAADPGDLGVATSTIVFSRSLGSSFGAAIFWSILLASLSRHLEAAGMAQARAAIFNGAALSVQERAAILEALVHAFHVVFTTACGVAAIGIVLGFFLKEVPLRTTSRLQLADEPA